MMPVQLKTLVLKEVKSSLALCKGGLLKKKGACFLKSNISKAGYSLPWVYFGSNTLCVFASWYV